ncbi:class I SAM-dependent methyltransferase [Bdellovibrionota bacterium FG-2]
MCAQDLDDPNRVDELRRLIETKGFLKRFYAEVYAKYAQCLRNCPSEGLVLELGSGASFVKKLIPETITSDTIAYAGIDQIVDATQMPFADQSLRAIFMMNVFHHIPDAASFLAEASRCLKKGGRIFILDQHVSPLSKLVFQNAHHEPFDPTASDWKFASSGPLSGANGALAWIVFRRDYKIFESKYPDFKLLQYSPHTPSRYWISGGLKSWALAPGFLFHPFTLFDRGLAKISSKFCSFVDIEIVKN